jgi:CheY-like chemotaxis protein
MGNNRYQDQSALEKSFANEINDKPQVVSGMKILIVDDSPINFKFLRELLSGLKVHITESLSGESALKLFRAERPDLILIDVNMFGVDGYDISRMIGANNKSDPIPIIFLTATTKTADIIKDLSFGAVDYIFKPFDSEKVLLQIHNQLALRKRNIIRNSLIS